MGTSAAKGCRDGDQKARRGGACRRIVKTEGIVGGRRWGRGGGKEGRFSHGEVVQVKERALGVLGGGQKENENWFPTARRNKKKIASWTFGGPDDWVQKGCEGRKRNRHQRYGHDHRKKEKREVSFQVLGKEEGPNKLD